MLQSQKDRAPGKARPKTPPKMGPSMERAKEASAAAVMEAVLSIAADSASVLLGSPEDPGLTFDQIFDWHGDHTGVPYRSRGSRTFEEYLRAAFWDQTESGGSTGYRDPGWSRAIEAPGPESLLDAKQRMHAYSNHNRLVPSNCELIGISVGDLRRHLGLDVRRRPFHKSSDEHARSRTVSGCLRHSASLVPEPGRPLNTHNGLDCAMDTGGWFLVDEFLDKINRHVFAHRSRVRSAMTLEALVRIASDGTEDLTKMRWQFSVLLRRDPRPRASFWQRIIKVFGIRAVVGQPAVGFLEDDRLQVPAVNVPDEVFACITHNTYEEIIESIITNGLLPGGGGITHAVHSQLSEFHIGDSRLQESSRGSTTTAAIHFNVEKTTPLLNVCASGVLATRHCLPGGYIDRSWAKREVPIRIRDGRMVVTRRWITYADTRAVDLRITGWIGARKSGYSDEFKDAIKRLNKHSRSLAFEDVFKQMALSHGVGDFTCKCCPQCGYPMLRIQTDCLECGMIATYEGAGAKSIISVEALKKVEDDALAARVGSAPRVAMPYPAIAQPTVEEEETIENLTDLEADEKLMARLLEYTGSTQLVSMRASNAKAIFRSIKHRLAWRAFPEHKQRMTDPRKALVLIPWNV